MKFLEVIVTSAADAIEAQAGGADRLEVVRDLASGGLTPDLALVVEILSLVSIPIRVMLRERCSMELSGPRELASLRRQAEAFSGLSIDGLVLGFTREQPGGSTIDTDTVNAILSVAPALHATFHRAFDCLADPIAAISILKTIPQIDRILTAGGPGSWDERKLCLHLWQQHAGAQIKIIAGAGLVPEVFADLTSDPVIEEIHVGRAARNPPETFGPVARLQVARLKAHTA